MLTAAYGAYALIRPEHLARQVGIDAETATRVGRVLGVRDLVWGTATVVATAPATVRTALLARTAFDALDLVGFGLLAPTRSGRLKAGAAAAAWGVLSTVLLVAQRRAAHGGAS